MRPFLFLSCFLFPALLAAGALLAAPAAATPLTLQTAAEIRALLPVRDAPGLRLGREVELDGRLAGFYAERGHAPAWIGDRGLTAVARELLDLLRGAGEEGLCPEDYHLAQLEPLFALEGDSRRYGVLFDPAYLARLDLLLSDAFLRYAADLARGRVDPSAVLEGWRSRRARVDLTDALRRALAGGRVGSVLQELAPSHPEYLRLRAVFADYRRLCALGGWPSVPEGPVLRPGAADPRVPRLRARLTAGGDLPEPAADAGDRYDPATVAAVVRFQSRHGLQPDGVLGPMTLAALNVPVEERIRQIELNLERWRWLPRDLGERHIRVNVADFQLRMVEGAQTVIAMPVVVGTTYRKTPVFSARLTHLIFAPYWVVPPTILREDKLPLIKADPAYLGQHHFELVRGDGAEMVEVDPGSIRWAGVKSETFPGMLRQKPGPWNPLGRVKFMLPNRFDVYLHDTPDRRLFARDARTFSSGCIRIERPLDLAAQLLAEQGWSRADVAAAMNRGEPLRVDLGKPLPVHVLYWTAWVDEEGELQLRPDIYLRDLDLDLALGGGTASG